MSLHSGLLSVKHRGSFGWGLHYRNLYGSPQLLWQRHVYYKNCTPYKAWQTEIFLSSNNTLDLKRKKNKALMFKLRLRYAARSQRRDIVANTYPLFITKLHTQLNTDYKSDCSDCQKKTKPLVILLYWLLCASSVQSWQQSGIVHHPRWAHDVSAFCMGYKNLEIIIWWQVQKSTLNKPLLPLGSRTSHNKNKPNTSYSDQPYEFLGFLCEAAVQVCCNTFTNITYVYFYTFHKK